MITIAKADRLKELPPYLFAELDRRKDAVRARGVDVIDIGVGDPDQPTPGYIIEALAAAARVPAYHRYPSYSGMNSFREAVSAWYQKRAGITLDPLRQVVSLIGSKEGIAHIPLAFINPGDVVLVPSPGYPVYKTATLFAGGTPYEMPLLKENGFLPDLTRIPATVLAKAKMIFLNYPNNPTAATATREFFMEVVAFAERHDIMVCHDFAYSEMAFDGYEPPSFLATPGAMEVGIEFHSLSKTYHMTGWRLGFAAGRAEIIGGLGQIKSNIDSGVFEAIQMAGITAMADDAAWLAEMRALYTARRDVVMAGLTKIGIQAATPKATFYVWAEVPKGYTSASFASHLLENAGIVTTPGNGFGDPGEGYFRIALTVSKERLAEAMERMAKAVG
ncbi:MAG: LL-diaminopimelate aminotransferase [Deltaproteobacteria bacterium CG_4_10_14_3_um_filter_60_8]|nr:MAG: LL-diaminopimelate aminotransferase [Desulfobacterales bacterium CG2_30_60_27]PIY25282.1 MAG: LL-diaminopimelate aminotransferase [Deltaproteobacteria bacterium CG_4_10_14_3_um_filter_60_8]